LTLPQQKSQQHRVFSTDTSAWELEVTISITGQCEAIGFHIRHNEDLSIRTTISFSPLDETITVRGSSSLDVDVNKCSEMGPFTLFETVGCGQADSTSLESLHLRIFSDGELLEVFANDRFALVTMVYSRSCHVNNGLTAYATGDQGYAVFESIGVWDGLNGMRSLVIDPDEN
jgi:beta-fructofuranosidase